MIKTAGVVVATVALATACTGHSSPGASSHAPTAAPSLTDATPSASARDVAVRLCDVLARTVEPEIAKASKAKDGSALFTFVTAPANLDDGLGAALLAATRAGAPDVVLAKDALLLDQNMFSAVDGTEFGTLATDVANLKQDCAPYR